MGVRPRVERRIRPAYISDVSLFTGIPMKSAVFISSGYQMPGLASAICHQRLASPRNLYPSHCGPSSDLT